MIVFAAFALLLVATLAHGQSRSALLGRSRADWTLDLTGLLIQGFAIPAAAAMLGMQILPRLWPSAHGSIDPPAWAGFLLAFVAVDYLYYWNHRLLHGRGLWPLHAAHHGSTRLDLISTSRNSLWTSFLIVYLWCHAAALFLLADPVPYSLGMAATAALDLYRHGGIPLVRRGRLERLLGLVLVTSGQHAAHHSRESSAWNFGANLTLWDRLHGTFLAEAPLGSTLGILSTLPVSRQLFLPFSTTANTAAMAAMTTKATLKTTITKSAA